MMDYSGPSSYITAIVYYIIYIIYRRNIFK